LYDQSADQLTITHPTGVTGIEAYTISGGVPTVPQIKIGRSSSQYWGVFTGDRDANVIHRQDETSGEIKTNFQHWDSNTSDTTGSWNFQHGDGDGGSMQTCLTIKQNGDMYMKASAALYMDGGGDTYIQESSANTLIFATGGTTRLTLDSTKALFAAEVEAGSLDINGNADISGTLNVSSNITTNHVLPVTDSTYNVGSSSVRYANGYFDTVHGDGSNLTNITSTDSSKLPLSGGTITGNVKFNDNIELRLGSGSDLKQYHSGTHGYIDNNTGDLIIQCDSDDIKILAEDDVVIRDNDDSTEMAKFINGGAVELYHNGSKKLDTASAGVEITGELQADTLDIDGNADISGNINLGGDVTIINSIIHAGDTNTFFGFHDSDQWRVVTNSTERLEVSNSGIKLGATGATVSSIQDQDDMASNSATALATQQSIKAYVDSSVASVAEAANLNAIDDRDMAPEDYGYTNDLKVFFSTKEGLEAGSGTGSNYQDVLYLNSYSDASGGDANILAFDKSEMKIYHYQADQAATNWGTAKQLAYTDSDISGDTTGTAAIATSITATANNSTNETVYLTFVDGATGTQGIETDTGLSYNPSTGALTTNSILVGAGITHDGDINNKIAFTTDTQTFSCDGNESLILRGNAVSNEPLLEINGAGAGNQLNIGLLLKGITDGNPIKMKMQAPNDSSSVTGAGILSYEPDADTFNIGQSTSHGSMAISINNDDQATMTNVVTLSGGFILDGNTITGVDDSGEFTNDDAHIMTSAGIEDKILGYGYTTNTGDATLSGTQTFSGAKTFSAAVTVSNSTASSSKTTGAVKVTGGVGIQGALNVGGDVTAFASSDERYKDNLQVITNPIDKVKSLTGYTFTWNDKHKQFNGNNDIGVVAQEVEKVFPEIVDTRDDGYKAVKYEKMVALLIEAVKDQQKQIDELKEKCNGCSR